MKVALVHDWLLKLGGAERVLIALHRIFPEAPIHTLFYDKSFSGRYLGKAEIRPSFLQKIPNIKKLHPWFKFLMPSAAESFDFSRFDLVISSSHEFVHGVITRPETKLISYYHSPSRLLWDRSHDYLRDFRKRNPEPLKLALIRIGQHFLRLWDWPAARRPNVMVANSKHVAERIKKYYGRDAKVIYPPVEVPRGSNSSRSFSLVQRLAPRASAFLPLLRQGFGGDHAKKAAESARRTAPARLTNDAYFLIVSQLYPHKNLDLAVQTFKKLPEFDLVIIGQGPERKRLQKMIGESGNIKLSGFVPDEELPNYYENCLAYLICNEEDFGISSVEAMFFGKPVLALRKGGSTESVIKGETGEFFDREDEESLKEGVNLIHGKIKKRHYDSQKISKHAENFGFERFKKEMLEIVNEMG